MVALVDCNSFFCSVEKVFHPGLSGKAVCVLSSNDGCIVALTPEAKALGLRRGDPLFKVKGIVDANGVRIFSGNMKLYSAMSERIVRILRKSVARVENYSIDESFCYLDGYEQMYDLTEFMRDVAARILLYTDIPVSVGIAPTKTLAKIGSLFAKRFPGYRGVCTIDTEEKRLKALAMTDLGDVWGIGRRTLEKLNYYGVKSTLALAEKKESWIRLYFNKQLYCTWLELNGKSCIDTAEVIRNQSICTSRSFGQSVDDYASLQASVATFASSCANKLRSQRALASSITVFLYTNRFDAVQAQYSASETTCFLMPTSDTLEISKAALDILRRIYIPGVRYKKSGVILGEISSCSSLQLDLFDTIKNRGQRVCLMKTIDTLNQRYGPKTISTPIESCNTQHWQVKSEFRTPNYLTDINELLTVKI